MLKKKNTLQLTSKKSKTNQQYKNKSKKEVGSGQLDFF